MKRTKIVFLLVVALAVAIGAAVYIGNYSRRSKAAVGANGVSIVFAPSTGTGLLTNTNQSTTVTVTPVNSAYKVSGLDLRIIATGNVQLVDITAPSGLPASLSKTVAAQSARISYATTVNESQLPAFTQFQIQYKALTAGTGTIQVVTSESEVVGSIPTSNFELDSVIPTGTYTFIAPSPTPTLTPTKTPTPTIIPSLTFNVVPEFITAGGTSTFTWTANNVTSCTASGSWTGTKSASGTETVGPISATSTYTLTCTGPAGPITHTRSVTVNPTPTPTKSPTPTPTKSPTPTPVPCPTRSIGDANCDGKATLSDFEWWRREFTGAVGTKNADFNADGLIQLSDFEIWRTNAFN